MKRELTLCALPNDSESHDRELFKGIFCFHNSVLTVAFSHMHLFIAAQFNVPHSAASQRPFRLFIFPFCHLLFHFLSIFSSRDRAVPFASNICSVWLLPPLCLSSLPPTLKCFSSVCLASNPPQSLLSFIHENADPQQGREKRQQT